MTKEEKREYNKAYYLANKDRILERHREYYRAGPKEYWRKYNHRRYMENREKLIEQARQNEEKNMERYASEQACIKVARVAAGMSQKDVADKLGLNPKTISAYESGKLAAPWDRLAEVIPGLKKEEDDV